MPPARRIATAAVTALLVTLAAPGARADDHAWNRRLVCHISDPTHGYVSPTFDDALHELTYLGRGRPVTSRAKAHPGEHHYVAFTFDDGPRWGTTDEVMRALERYDVPATFYVVTNRFTGTNKASRRNKKLLEELVARGFHVGNHTVSHANLRAAKPEEMKREIDHASAAIEDVTGFAPYTFRPPYGKMNDRARAYLAQRAATVVRWSIDSLDFHADARDTMRERVFREILADDGGVVLMHDTKKVTAKVVPKLLDDLERENCKRLKRKDATLIVPVSLHYFIWEKNGEPRPVPHSVRARTRAYLEALPTRCAKRKSKR